VSLRSRLTLAASVAVAVAVAAAAGATYLIVRGELRGEIDSSLRERAASAVAVVPARAPRILTIPRLPPPAFGGAPGYVQLVTARGIVVRAPLAGPRLPAEARARAVASGQSGAFFTDTRVQGIHVRVLTTRLGPRTALQVARPLTEVDRTLRRLRRILLVIVAGGIALAAALGTGVARAALAPLRRLSETAGQVTRTRDLSRRVEATGRDELGRLAASFNTMLGALDESMRAQRQLVADASHELRTPLTSLRTNVEVLTRQERLSQEEYRRLLGDIVAQTEELASLVADVVELARESRPEVEAEDVRLDLLVEHAVERARRNSPHVRFELEGEPTVVRGVTSRLERAVGNLLDNAAKWSPTGSPIEVSVRGGEVVVRDHGPGISEADLPHVFDRFYRAPDARRLPGSGLGLAIVRQVAELHGGVASAEQAEGGGARFRLKLA
jgi:two-component system sensor histidine kinase MprB